MFKPLWDRYGLIPPMVEISYIPSINETICKLFWTDYEYINLLIDLNKYPGIIQLPDDFESKVAAIKKGLGRTDRCLNTSHTIHICRALEYSRKQKD